MQTLTQISSFQSEHGPFRNLLGEGIFLNKYKHEGAETWEELAYTLAADVCGDFLPSEMVREIAQMIAEMKFVPGGRYLYYAGRPNKYFNNCLSGNTRLLTDTGYVALRDVAGETVNVISPVNGEAYPATVHNHGTQRLNQISFRPLRGRTTHRVVVEATENHRWQLQSGEITESLRVGDKVLRADVAFTPSKDGLLHGLVYGDGTLGKSEKHRTKKGLLHQYTVCDGNEIVVEDCLEESGLRYTTGEDRGHPKFYIWSDTNMKNLPYDESPEYISGFIMGYLMADGHRKKDAKDSYLLASINRDALQFVADHAPLAGYCQGGEIRSQIRDTQFAKDHKLFFLNVTRIDDKPLVVESIEYSHEEEVYCPEEPVHSLIVIDHGLVTGNCFLFRAEHDTREEWADLIWRNTSALLSGGGTGNNFSIIREKDAALKSTGGKASGPVSLMKAIDEGGRQWRQGGGRRSALYGLLNWQHPDAYHPEKYGEFGIGHDWISAKDWDNLPVAGAFDQEGNPLTVQKARDNDWNHPAPLECTNISLGYDDEFIRQTFGDTQFDLLKQQPNMRSRKIFVDDEFITPPETFIKNVEMAMRNGEPGFSFDMFEKINETLRNACTEVTSEDDSDVCNLGSLNMSRIETLEEFERLTELGTLFLLCGTRKAMLPFEKIAKVREKNRRLGLGIMGVHEWLLQRNYRYEMNDELRSWLEVYENKSDEASASYSDTMGISRPVANRAIAPTGSIGTMVGTTTGIEPIYAVAYIRASFRGNVRHEEYVIEDIAEQMINRYGLKPDDIETANDLALDPERRIKFQADVQDYVDMAISSTLNLPAWMSEHNNPSLIERNAKIVARYAPRLRGLTFYPDGSRGGQPLKMVPYSEAFNALHSTEAYDACKSGVCGI